MFVLLGISLSLVGLLAINSTVSLMTLCLWHRITHRAETWSGTARAQFLFLLRVAPALIAVFCVGALFIPSYLRNEPRHTAEIVTVKLGIIAATSLYGIAFALWRGVARWVATRRLMKNWMQCAEPVSIKALAIPALRFPHKFPIVAIVGAIRPRLFIADQILDALTPAELSAAVSHEKGHLAAGDNLKRSLMRACRDVLAIVPWGRSLDSGWAQAAEFAADERAARGGPHVALDLASALVKIARLAPRGASPAMPAGASLIAEDLGGIAARVLRLTRMSADISAQKETGTRLLNLATGACASAFAFAIFLAVCSPNLMSGIHATLEYVVSVFQ